MTIYILTLLYPVILCNLTLERIRHKLLTSGLIRRNTCHPAYNTVYGTFAMAYHRTTLWESISGPPAGCAVKNRELLYCKMQRQRVMAWGCVGARKKHVIN